MHCKQTKIAQILELTLTETLTKKQKAIINILMKENKKLIMIQLYLRFSLGAWSISGNFC